MGVKIKEISKETHGFLRAGVSPLPVFSYESWLNCMWLNMPFGCCWSTISFLSPFGDMICSGIYLSAILTRASTVARPSLSMSYWTYNQHTKKLQPWSEHLSSGPERVCEETSPTGRCVFCTTWESHNHTGAEELSYFIFSLVSSLIDHTSLSRPHELHEYKHFQLPLSIGCAVQKVSQ